MKSQKIGKSLAGLVAGSALIASVAVYQWMPSLALEGIYAGYRWRSGVAEKAVSLGDGESVEYFEGGPRTAPEMVLVHGFGDSKNSFVQSARWLGRDHHLLLPEMRGFGGTERNPARNHSIRSQVARLKAFLDAPGVLADPSKPLVLVGNSMGGHISAAFALAYPERVRALVLLSPAGLRVDDPIPYRPVERAIETDADFDDYMKKVFYKTPWIPGPFRAEFLRNSRRDFEWLQRLRSEIREGEDYILNERIGGIHAPTLVIWGEHDGVVRPAHAPVWAAGIPRAKLIRIEDGGHSPQYEMPERTANWILDFLAAVPSS